MESIFGADDALQEERQPAKDKKPAKRSSGKDFSSDLQAFLQDAFDESLEQQLEERRRNKPAPARGKNVSVKKRSRRPMGGLDSLIRSTVDAEPLTDDAVRAKRVTLTFDPEKLERLQHIARNERTYLKDIIDRIVADYLSRYEDGV